MKEQKTLAQLKEEIQKGCRRHINHGLRGNIKCDGTTYLCLHCKARLQTLKDAEDVFLNGINKLEKECKDGYNRLPKRTVSKAINFGSFTILKLLRKNTLGDSK